MSGERQQLAYDPELLYVGAMFHDLGLVAGHRSDDERFEVDGANAAAAFLKPYGLSDDDIEQALRTTLSKFEHQSGLRAHLELHGHAVGMDLAALDMQRRVADFARVGNARADSIERVDQVADRPLMHARHAL